MEGLCTTLGIMRNMAWERAKGELHSITVTYISSVCKNSDEAHKYRRFSELLDAFIKDVESEGLVE